ncbi:MAG: hypothetical protein ACK2US_13150 [Anaerolineae bacterium]|jgi:uncharacterized protein YxjI
MEYPLNFSFKILALSPQLAVTDAGGNLIYYVKQKLFKLKEEVTVFADQEQTQPLYKINADRVIDFSARYHFSDTTGNALGSVKRQGMKSLWKASYDILDGEEIVMNIVQENPWIGVVDSILEQIPLVSIATSYLLHPKYLISRADGTPVRRLTKQPAFFEGKFRLDKLADISEAEERRAILSLLMMVLLERARG